MNIRDELQEVINAEALSGIEFVNIRKWQWVLNRFAENILINGVDDLKYIWLWERFREPVQSVQLENSIDAVNSVLKGSDVFWFIATDEDGKYWVLSGTGSRIISLLNSMRCFEYYILTKDIESVLCENHHGVLLWKGKAFRELGIA